MAIINHAYPPGCKDTLFRQVAIEMLGQSIDVINSLSLWIEETYEILTGVESTASDVSWSVITKILRRCPKLFRI